MQIVATKSEIESSGTTRKSMFSIKNTKKSFEILSSGLYSDKPGAIVRELSCNGADSHTAAGKSTLPIEIKLPSFLEQTFYVKDFGTGMSDIQVRGYFADFDINDEPVGDKYELEAGELENNRRSAAGEKLLKQFGGVYNTYFESTKTESNDYIGQLGLGSKTPFSYASTFMVESRFDGVRTLYSCYKDEDGMPAITQMSREAYTDDTGMTISMAVRKDDIDKFTAAAKRQLMYFKPVPKVVGNASFAPHTVRHLVQGSAWKVRYADYYAHMSGAYVVQGFVSYPIDKERLLENGLTGIAAKLAETDIDMYVPIGAVEVAASREALSYDKRTITNLIAQFNQAAIEIRASFQDEFDKCANAFEAALALDKFQHTGTEALKGIFKEMHRQQPFQFNSADISQTFLLDLSKIHNVELLKASVNSKGKLHIAGKWDVTNEKKFEYSIVGNTTLIYDDNAKGSAKTISAYLSRVGEKDGRSATAFIIRTVGKREEQMAQQEAKKIAKQLGDSTIVPVESMPQMTRTAGKSGTYKYTKRAKGSHMAFGRFPRKVGRHGREEVRRVFSRLTWNTMEVDYQDPAFYVRVERFTAVDSKGHGMEEIDDMIRHAKALGLMSKDAFVYGLNDNELRSVPKHWVEFSSGMPKLFKAKNKMGEMTGRALMAAVFSQIGGEVRDSMVNVWTDITDRFNDGQFKKMMTKLHDFETNAGAVDATTVNAFMSEFHITSELGVQTQNMVEEYRSAIKGYPMLALIDSSYFDHHDVIAEYVNSIDK